ncbi:hypothetical protein ACJRO7_034612 [Eucalyptus globulus]|uniref:Uncharacterized protein n=1 Tax=Eucalyptus globulus TaxID=34317 RepID=A0ABD3J7A3_EUCGL
MRGTRPSSAFSTTTKSTLPTSSPARTSASRSTTIAPLPLPSPAAPPITSFSAKTTTRMPVLPSSSFLPTISPGLMASLAAPLPWSNSL